MNVGVGVLVAGFVEAGHPGVGAMAIGALISLAVALTAGFAFTFLLEVALCAPRADAAGSPSAGEGAGLSA